ncbi:BnaC05g25480D [Brassica napus]|uniref:BnaC05g25480D protein n=2 Tax=Brassica napus TaxID=3708 RepID=A0A078GK86_BRANA|nr:BnaC05g25480D [Brassica napus]
MLKAFKEEILTSFRNANSKACVATEPTTPPPVTTSKGLTPANPPVGGLDANDATILNVLENISHYSTPPRSADRVTFSEGRPHNVRRDLTSSPRMDAGNHGVTAFSANSKTNEQNEPASVIFFGDRAETVDDPMHRRTSKRLRLVPPPMISDYQCRQLFSTVHVKAKWWVFDILMRLVRSTCYNHVGCSGATKPEFLDSRFVSILCKNYERFKKSKAKDSYVFPKGLVDCTVKCCSYGNASTRFYLPLYVAKKHWIGLCVDFTAVKIYVLDCNPAVCGDSELTRELLPISDMFPYLLKFCGLLEVPGNNPLCQERVKGVAQNNNSTEAALTAALLIQTHPFYQYIFLLIKIRHKFAQH